jgi:glycosyltransferase involved in cell wall biosynthesis
MHLVVLSYKRCWKESASPSGWATDGGFPLQMAAIADLFEYTTLVLPERRGLRPAGTTPLAGHGLAVHTFPEPPGRDIRRKLALLLRLPSLLVRLWREIGRGDAVHAVVPGDIGGLGILLALLRRKLLFVRHCGTWGNHGTLADQILWRVLVRIAGRRRTVVLATGGGRQAPEPRNPAIRWIFSTSLTLDEMAARPAKEPWRPGGPLQILSVGRLARGKNTATTIRALQSLRREVDARLDVLGDGPELASLRTLVLELGLQDAVTFHGNVAHAEVLTRLDKAHVLVFPTRVAEGFPKAVIEAMACGAIVVAPPVSVVPRLLDGCGVLLDDTTPEAVTTALQRLLTTPDEMATMSEASRRVAATYTLEAWREAIGEALQLCWKRPTDGGKGQ